VKRSETAPAKGVIVHALDANGGTAVTTKSLTSEKMEARVARFNKLQTYQRQNFEAHNIPPGAVEKVAARRVYPVMAPADYRGRSAGAPVNGPRGLIVLPSASPATDPACTAISIRLRTFSASPAVSRSPGAIGASTRSCWSHST
jgi:hypothetical protein